ncbi:MAG: ferritin [Bacteroidota bacterium]
MSSENLHEKQHDMKKETIDIHRAIVSLCEELDAWDWYNQRVDAVSNHDLKKILIHNRNEEKEHAAMLIEWLRRNDNFFEGQLKEYLFTDKSIADIERES